ncbi:MAG: hypothetical protein IH588_19210, partial [Anaerolineales bacterium]|nr:hypothetical protein [Anaerolineales bacterium]
MSKLNNFINFLSVPIFVQRAYRELDRINDDDYFLRKGDGTKKFVDEILPLTVFLKHFERPGRKIRCRYFPESQNYDAIIKISGNEVKQGFLESSYFVEVTIAEEEYTEHLRRESLARYGYVFGGDNIRRVKNKKSGTDIIQSKPVVQDIDHPVKNAIELVKKALEKKNQKPYPSPCILIVELQPQRILSLTEWLTLINEVRDSVNRDKFRSTYIVN